MAPKPPEVLWRDTTRTCAHIYWRGFILYFKRSANHSGRVYCSNRPVQCGRMPDEIYREACRLSAQAMSDHALRDEMQLRWTGKLDEARVISLAGIVHAQVRRNGDFKLTPSNVWEATKSSLGVLGTPGTIRAVAIRLMQQRHEASVRTNARGHTRKARARADNQLNLFSTRV